MRVHTVRDLGAVVRQARTDHRMTQAELAARVGVSRDWVVRLEKGHPRLEAQLVLDALEAAGVNLTVGVPSDQTPRVTEQLWDDMFADLSADHPDSSDGQAEAEHTDG